MGEKTSPLPAIGNEVVIFYRRGGVPPNPTVENGGGELRILIARLG